MPHSEIFEITPVVHQLMNFLSIDDDLDESDETPKLSEDSAKTKFGVKHGEYATKFIKEMKVDSKIMKSMHWSMAQKLFWFDYARLWSTTEAGGHSSFSNFITNNQSWLPLGLAQLSKFKRCFYIYIYKLRCHEDEELLDMLLRANNIDKLSTISSYVTKENIWDWLYWLQDTENVKMPDVLEAKNNAKVLSDKIDNGEVTDMTKDDITPETATGYYKPPKTEFTFNFDTLVQSGIDTEWYGKLKPESKVKITRKEYDTKTIIEIKKVK